MRWSHVLVVRMAGLRGSSLVDRQAPREQVGSAMPAATRSTRQVQRLADVPANSGVLSRKPPLAIAAGGRHTMRVLLESPNQPEIIALIAELDAYQDSLYPAEARYALDLDSLSRPNVLFAVARSDDGAAVGCAAIVLGESYGEVKRMYVRPEARGRGVARRLCNMLEASAHANGCRTLMLETGPYQPDALAFYAMQGFERCGAFGSYPEHPLSVFMCKQLSQEAATGVG